MIICTGFDNTGKTTLTERVVREYDVELRHSPGPISYVEQKDWIVKQLIDCGNQLDGEIIYDRFACFEEMVYGPILRSGSLFNFEDNEVQLLKIHRPIIVYTRPPKKVIFNFGTREQMEGVIERKETLLAAYDELMFKLQASGWNVLIYDYTEPRAFELLMLKISKILGGN